MPRPGKRKKKRRVFPQKASLFTGLFLVLVLFGAGYFAHSYSKESYTPNLSKNTAPKSGSEEDSMMKEVEEYLEKDPEPVLDRGGR
jgi:isopentenyl phosphate kinase